MRKNKIYILLILLFSLLYFIWIPNYFIGDDSLFHTSNIIANAATKSIFPSKILPMIESNLGYGVNIFYPPLPHLLGSYIYRLTHNIEITMQLLQFLCIFLSGITMYLYTTRIFQKKEQCLLASLFYISTPYLFTDVFARGALNESFIFCLLPIIFLSFHYLIKKEKKKFYICFVLGFSLSIITHLVLTVYIALFSCIYLLFYIKKIFTKEIIKQLLLASILVLGITSPFWWLLLEHYFQNSYYIFQIKYIMGENFLLYPFYLYIFPKVILSGAFNPLRFYLSEVSYPFFVFAVISFFQNKITKSETKKVLAFLSIFLFCLCLESIPLFWSIIPNLFKNIQFPWRLSLIIAFANSVVASYGIKIFESNQKKYILSVVIILLLIFNYSYTTKLDNKKAPREYFNSNSNEIYSWQKEYLPQETIKFQLNLISKEEIFKMNPNIKVLKNEVPNLIFQLTSSEKIELELPRIYYLGYELKNDNNQKIILRKSQNGLLEATLKQSGTYYLNYKGTLIWKISRIVSLFSIIIMIKIIYHPEKKKKY